MTLRPGTPVGRVWTQMGHVAAVAVDTPEALGQAPHSQGPLGGRIRKGVDLQSEWGCSHYASRHEKSLDLTLLT